MFRGIGGRLEYGLPSGSGVKIQDNWALKVRRTEIALFAREGDNGKDRDPVRRFWTDVREVCFITREEMEWVDQQKDQAAVIHGMKPKNALLRSGEQHEFAFTRETEQAVRKAQAGVGRKT